MFTQDIVVRFFNNTNLPKVCEYIIEVLKRVGQLTNAQVIGLMLASFNIGGSCWIGTGKLLSSLDQDRRKEVLQMFQMYLSKQYTESIADWCCSYWR